MSSMKDIREVLYDAILRVISTGGNVRVLFH